MYETALFIFRRDLRLEDNTGLIAALENAETVIPCFILNPEQLKDNEYRSDNAVQFMINSLKELNEELKKKGSKLYIFEGSPEQIIKKLKGRVDAVFVNRDYTPFSIKRDGKIRRICEENNIEFATYADYLLHEPDEVKTGERKPYTIFTPYLKKCKELDIRSSQKSNRKNYYSKPIKEAKDESIFKKILPKENPNIFKKGGRKEALQILKNIDQLKNYKEERDIPHLGKTTGLSAHHKFGTISMRESYEAIRNAFGPNHTLISELHWHDFFTQIAYFFPHIFGHAFREKYDKIKWSKNKSYLTAWKQGLTGFPIVDAGMRELNETGYMHNRVRMIVASFLTKDLHISWREGEKYFAQKLVDYDPAVNNGNWQWAASTGCDAQPYFRIFNPWRQQERFDPECTYIKRWIPELKNLTPKQIHNLQKNIQIA